MDNLNVYTVTLLLIIMVAGAMATVMTRNLLRAAIALAGASSTLAVLMFMLGAELAAVFELSVCAGLIPAIFITAIGLTRRPTEEAEQARRTRRLKTLWLLPVLVVLVGAAMSQVHIPADFMLPLAGKETDVRNVLWNLRHLDLIGQVVVLLGGAFGVVVLLKELKRAN